MSTQSVQTAEKKTTLRVEEYINTYMRQSTIKTCVKNYILELEKIPEIAKLIPVQKVKEPDPNKQPKVSKKPVDPNKPKPKYKLNKRAILFLTVLSDYIVEKIVGKTIEKVKSDNKKIIQSDNFTNESITGLYWKLSIAPTTSDEIKKMYSDNKNLLTIKNAIKKQIDIEKGEFKKSDIFTGFVALNVEMFIKKICERLFMNGIYLNSKTIKYEDVIYVLTERADAHFEVIPEDIIKKYAEVEKQFLAFEAFKNDKDQKTAEPPKTTKFITLEQKVKQPKQPKQPKQEKKTKVEEDPDVLVQPPPPPVSVVIPVTEPEPPKKRGGKKKTNN